MEKHYVQTTQCSLSVGDNIYEMDGHHKLWSDWIAFVTGGVTVASV